jgi:hypothetical protein
MPRLNTLAAPALLLLVAAAGCASGTTNSTSRPDVKNTQSGFLRDYSRLKPSPRHRGTLYQQSRELASYTGFMVDPVVVLPGETVRGDPIDGAQAANLSESLRRELSDTLALRNKLAANPGPGIARIRAAITSVAKSDRSAANRSQAKIGGAGVEAEIVDSLTGKRLGAVVDADIVEDAELAPGGPGSSDPFYDARLVFRHWAGRLNLWLESADELATE